MNDMEVEFKRRRFSVAEYHQLFKTGVLGEGTWVELIDGEVIEMPPIGHEHRSLHSCITQYLMRALFGRATIFPMGSFPLGAYNEPQPDIAIFPYDAGAYLHKPNPAPDEFVAFIEIAATSLGYDSTAKMRLYARFGIPDYVIVDVKKNRLLHFRDPGPDGYVTRRDLGLADMFSFVNVPDVSLDAAAFLDPDREPLR